MFINNIMLYFSNPLNLLLQDPVLVSADTKRRPGLSPR
uniref:Uncharacterized protein n=1 Tax=Triticum urartu TaxID=4572 RepID=A0A8R7P7Z1_TRIUA